MIPEQQIEVYQKNILERLAAPNITWEETLEMGLAARNLRDLANWMIGQIAARIHTKWGEANLNDFARALGLHRTTIEQYRWVIIQFGIEYKPTEGLPWSFYRLAAGTQNPKDTINKIVDENLTYQQAQNLVRGLPLARECVHEIEEVVYLQCKICRMISKKPK